MGFFAYDIKILCGAPCPDDLHVQAPPRPTDVVLQRLEAEADEILCSTTPVFGMMQRGGQVVTHLLANVQQKTIEPFIKDTIVPGTLV